MEKPRLKTNTSFIERMKRLQDPLPSYALSLMPKKYFEKSNKQQLLVYKDARIDIQRLNEVVGIGYWRNKYRRDPFNNALYSIIEIWNPDINQWVQYEDVGIPSAYEKVKGEVSDSFKRAGTKLGIGVHLYDMPNITVDGQVKNTSSWTIRYSLFPNKKYAWVAVFDGFGKTRFLWKHRDFDKSKNNCVNY